MTPPNELTEMMKEFYASWIGKLTIVLIIGIIGIMTVHILHLEKDNPIEQASEVAIKGIIGIKPDLTPEIKE